MKNSNFILLSMLILNLSNGNSYSELITLNDFKEIHKKSLYRTIFFPTILALTACFNQKKILETVQNNPFSSSVCLYLMGNYLLDSYYQYKKINSMLDILKSSEKINSYLLCIILLQENKESFKSNSQVIDDIINNYCGLHINEIEEFTATINKKVLLYLNKFDAIYFDFEVNNLANFLLKKDFTINEIIHLFNQDADIQEELLRLEQHENIDITKLLEKLGFKIKNEIQILLEQKLKD